MKSPHQIEEIRSFLQDEDVQEELSLFDVDLNPALDDDTLLANYEQALSVLPAALAGQLRKLSSELADNSRAADIDLAKASETGRISMVDRAAIVERSLEAFSLGLEDLRGVSDDFSDAIAKYVADERPLLERSDTFENMHSANMLLSDLWHQSVEMARRAGIAEFRRLTNNENSPEIDQLRAVTTSRFVIDKEILQPMKEYSQHFVVRENEMRKQRDAEHSREKSHNNDLGPRLS